jgi:hypothetical protein
MTYWYFVDEGYGLVLNASIGEDLSANCSAGPSEIESYFPIPQSTGMYTRVKRRLQ